MDKTLFQRAFSNNYENEIYMFVINNDFLPVLGKGDE